MTRQDVTWDSAPITRPGVYSGIPLDIYHSAMITGDEPSVSSSMLRSMWATSPAEFWSGSIYNQARSTDDDDESKAMLLGRAAHHVHLGEKFFAECYAIHPTRCRDDKGYSVAWSWRYKEAKEWKSKQGIKTILSPSQAEVVHGMAVRLGAYPIVRGTGKKDGVLHGEIERSFFWRDPDTGIWLKSRPDVIARDGHYVDLKTTRSTSYKRLQMTIEDYGYSMQAGLLAAGCRALNLPFESFTFLFVQSTPPYCVRDVAIKEWCIDLGEQQNRAMLKVFADCWLRKHWPAPGNDRVGGWIELSPRAKERIESRLKFEAEEQAA